MTFVLDASVAVKWVVEETGADYATRLLGRSMVAPELFQAEVGHVLTKRVRGSLLSSEQARTGFQFVMRQVALSPIERLGQAALDLSLSLHHSMHDCYYLAAAEATDRPFLSADAVFVAKLRGTGRGQLVYLLGEEVPDA